MELYYDILLHIAGLLEAEGDYISLFQCSLVNKNMNLAVSRVLYRRVVLDPPPSNAFRLGRQDQELTPTWKSAGIENNAPHVTELQVTGFLVQRPASQNNFSDVLCDSLHKWKNLQTVTLAPKQYHPDVFTNALSALKSCTHLQHLAVNSSCCDESRAPLLVQLEGLTSVTLLNPTRVILQDLPEWLSRLEPTLTELHMMDNCGSVTPGVLKACAPHLSKIRSFALGLSYSVTNDDAFSFLDQLSALSSLDFRYYLQLRPPSVRPALSSLTRLTVRHPYLLGLSDAGHLTKWIRHLSSRAPLEKFKLVTDSQAGPTVGLDGLADHLGLKHGNTLRILDISQGFIGPTALNALCSRCTKLEVISIGTSTNVLLRLHEIFSPCSDLHTVVIHTPNAKISKVHIETDAVTSLMKSLAHLRRFTLNKSRWEASWITNDTREVVFSVQQLPPASRSQDSEN